MYDAYGEKKVGEKLSESKFTEFAEFTEFSNSQNIPAYKYTSFLLLFCTFFNFENKDSDNFPTVLTVQPIPISRQRVKLH